ncbi:unnamed protein product [Haemonchus placei]|uniref:DUF2045 domain containing protein n=1 Tax=Haemonchus placei TaxID=6290 RepID=A0A0N4W151_HAEPC|nr:unnamed protein product [Haemonchus placei]
MLRTNAIRELAIPTSNILPGDVGADNCSDRGGGSCGCIGQLFEKIIALRRSAPSQDGGYYPSKNSEIEWAKLFIQFILGTDFCRSQACKAHSDDMIWYVHRVKINTSFCIGNPHMVQVFRRSGKNLPVPCDEAYNWEETVCLNLVLQQIDFYVTCAVCTKTSPQNLQIIRKNCQKVYPSPSRRSMDSKGENEEITYPKLYFAIDAFEEVFQDIVVRDGECVCVELVARDRQNTREAVVFLGSIRYDILKQVYDAKISSTWQWTQKIMKQSGRRQEFVGMRGPHKKGYAEMAVARVQNYGGYETPSLEGSIDFSEIERSWNQRRMSETNLPESHARFRSSLTPAIHARGRRWQSEADTIDKYPEVDGSNLDDELNECVLNRLWSVRGFSQAWHWLREKKRAQCIPLHAYLTYITLSWTSILQDLLSDRPKRPILTFELEALHDL